jgi:hypothetical protein
MLDAIMTGSFQPGSDLQSCSRLAALGEQNPFDPEGPRALVTDIHARQARLHCAHVQLQCVNARRHQRESCNVHSSSSQKRSEWTASPRSRLTPDWGKKQSREQLEVLSWCHRVVGTMRYWRPVPASASRLNTVIGQGRQSRHSSVFALAYAALRERRQLVYCSRSRAIETSDGGTVATDLVMLRSTGATSRQNCA